MAQTICQIIVIAIHVLTILFLVTAAGLFGDAYRRYNNELKSNAFEQDISKICILYFKKDSTHAKNSVCVFSIVGDALAALGLLVLILLSIVKLVVGLMG